MDNSETPKQYHPIDAVFYETFVDIEPDLLICGRFLTRNNEDAKDLVAAMLDATLNGTRPWPVGITLKRHMGDGMVSIYRNQRKAKTGLVLMRNPSRDLTPDTSDTPVSPYTHNPEEVYDDAEGSYMAERMEAEVFTDTQPESLERRVCLQARNGNTKVARVAELLGVTPRQVMDARAHLRVSKVRAVLHRHGLKDPKETQKPQDGE